jgi:hypothetical protein
MAFGGSRKITRVSGFSRPTKKKGFASDKVKPCVVRA